MAMTCKKCGGTIADIYMGGGGHQCPGQPMTGFVTTVPDNYHLMEEIARLRTAVDILKQKVERLERHDRRRADSECNEVAAMSNSGTTDKELEDWLGSKDHLYDCAAYSEAQPCCLDKGQKGRVKVEELLKERERAAKIEVLETLLGECWDMEFYNGQPGKVVDDTDIKAKLAELGEAA